MMLTLMSTHSQLFSRSIPTSRGLLHLSGSIRTLGLNRSLNQVHPRKYATSDQLFLRGTKPQTTRATVRFFAGTTDSLRPVLDFQPGNHTTNLKPSDQSIVDVMDIRFFDPPTQLAQEGCEWVRSTTKLREADLMVGDAKTVKSVIEDMYFKECAQLVKRCVNARKAVAYHYRHREQKSDPDDIQGFSSKPVLQFHIDNDSTTAERNLRNTLGDAEAESWLGRRWGIINIWRPLGDVVRQYPLALLDSREYDVEKAAVEIRTTSNYKSHFLGLKELPEYKFYYVSNMAPDEALLFVDYDSGSQSRVSGLGHGAMFDHNSSSDVPLRRSIEVRVLVLYD